MQKTRCECGNTKPISIDNELVCRNCAVVLGTEQYQEKAGVSRLNLYLQLETGARKVVLPGQTKNLHMNSNDMGIISDICGKLAIRSALQHDVLRIYRNVLGMKLSKAASACFAIYYVCRKDGVPFVEETVRAAVTMAFGVQHAPTHLRVNFKVGKIADITGTAWFAGTAGKDMPTTTKANPPLFYLRKHLKRLCDKNPDISYDDLYPYATKFFDRTYTVENAETRAKKAIRQTMVMAGIPA